MSEYLTSKHPEPDGTDRAALVRWEWALARRYQQGTPFDVLERCYGKTYSEQTAIAVRRGVKARPRSN